MAQEAEVDSQCVQAAQELSVLPQARPCLPVFYRGLASSQTWGSYFLSRTKITSLLGVPRTVRMLLWPGWGDQEATNLEVRHKLLLTGRSEVKGSRTISKGFPLNREGIGYLEMSVTNDLTSNKMLLYNALRLAPVSAA